MQPQSHPTHWPSLLLLITLIIGAVMLIGLAALMALASLMMLIDQDYTTLASAVTLAAGITLLTLLLTPAIYYAYRRVTGQKDDGQTFNPRPWRWGVFGLLFAWPASLAAGNWAANNLEWGWLVLPIANLAASGLPIAFLTAIGLRQIETGPRWRSWGIFGLGMTVGPMVMMAAEILLFSLLFIVILLYIGLTPGMVEATMQFSEQVNAITNEDEVLRLVMPILNSPKTIALVLFGVAICVPIIEELLKPIGVWLFAGYIRSPRQGFGLGILSGAAYALFETLGASSQANPDWATLVSARGGTSLLHILTTGLTAWALVSAWQERKYLRLGAVYAFSVFLHAVWNALNILNALGIMLKEFPDAPGWAQNISTPAMLVLGMEAGLMLVLLWLANRLVRQAQAGGPDPEAAK